MGVACDFRIIPIGKNVLSLIINIISIINSIMYLL